MYKITVFCVISGGVPEIEGSLTTAYDMIDDAYSMKFPRKKNQRRKDYLARIRMVVKERLITQDQLAGITALSIIAPTDTDGVPNYEEPELDEPFSVPGETVRAVHNCYMDSWDWDEGYVFGQSAKMTYSYNVSVGPNIMVQTTSLSILEAATEGRVTPLRLWRWCMASGKFDGSNMEDLIDFGDVDLDTWPKAFPGMEYDDFVGLEDKSEEEIYNTLVFKGLIWVWMRPDRFPAIPDDKCETRTATNVLVQTPTSTGGPGVLALGTLPVELLTLIVQELDLDSFLALVQTSRLVRALLMKPAILDALARQQPWTRPGRGPASKAERGWWEEQMKILKERHPEELGPGFDWRYLKRCFSDPSMMNRRRIWYCAEQIEELADAFEKERERKVQLGISTKVVTEEMGERKRNTKKKRRN